MKIISSLLLMVTVSILLSSCLQDECTETRTFVRFDPVYKTQAQLDAPISVQDARALRNPGIIYHYRDYILVNEFREGIHVINNTDPANPVNEAFIEIEGNEHFAIYKDQLQANKFNALLTIDITDIHKPVERSRLPDAFQEIWETPGRGFLVYHRQTDQIQTLDCSDPNFNSLRWENGNGAIFIDFAQVDFLARPAVRDQSGQGNSGIGGSTARFTVSHDHLYMVSDFELKVYDLEVPSRPVYLNTVNLGWGIETIYPFRDRLFIGSNSGMFVYDVATPSAPLLLSTFEHARACDPVVADDQTAFVTLRDGNTCEGFANQLDVIDITEVTSPYLLGTYAMEHPHGLALMEDHLFICEGDYGLKVMDVSNRERVREIDFLKDLRTYDVIALPNKVLLVVGKDGFYQFDASRPDRLELMSTIPVNDAL